MIRAATADDVETFVEIAIDAQMFEPEDRAFLEPTLLDSFTNSELGHRLIVEVDNAGAARGVAYYQPKGAPDRVWDLTMIAVRPNLQGRGVGRLLMNHIENELRQQDQRVLLIETSSIGRYDRTREFYLHLGYSQEATVRDYWEDGDDLILFRKHLQRD